jgi:hypothetical protein
MAIQIDQPPRFDPLLKLDSPPEIAQDGDPCSLRWRFIPKRAVVSGLIIFTRPQSDQARSGKAAKAPHHVDGHMSGSYATSCS